MIIIISLLIILVINQQGVLTNQQSIGPKFISSIITKQKIYYNNLGTILDCLAIGNPLPIITWFRINGTNDQSLTVIQPSEFIDLYENGSLFIRPFHEYFKPIHAGSYICQAENAIGSIRSIPIRIKPQIYDAYEIEVKNPYGFEQSSVIISCETSPPIASSYVNIIGWLEKVNNQVNQLVLQPKTKYNLLANKNLIIHNLTKSDDNKSYACIIKNQIDNNIKQSHFKSLRVRDRSLFGPELSVPNNTEYQAESGDTVELPCGIASLSSNAHISWWKDGSKIENIQEKLHQNSLILHLSSSSSNDSGIYTCQSNDELIGRMTSIMSLKVNCYLLVPIKCNMNIQQINIHAGTNSEVYCTINSIRTVNTQWKWYHNSMLLTNKLNRYIIINATRKHMGMYQCCFISNSFDMNSCCAQTQIRVINSPPFILLTNNVHSNNIIVSPNIPSHNQIDLNFTIYGHPRPDINIYKDGEKLLLNKSIEYLPSGDLFVHYPILISNINDTGLYECLANNSFGSISLSKHINIAQQKPFIAPLKNLTIRKNQEFTISCYASGQPNLNLQWIDETNKKIVNSSSTSPILFTTQRSQSTVYTCNAKNPHDEISSQVFVNIINPAKILSVTSNKTIKFNEKLEIYCSTDGDNPLELILKTPLITRKYENKNNLSIIINHIQMSDSGLYECYVKNNYSEDRVRFAIIVQNRPNKIENIFIENSQRISWIKPFDGNSKILRYILRIQYRQTDSTWSNETMIIINNNGITHYSLENIFSKCFISVRIQAENLIDLSLPSDPVQFQTNAKYPQMAPYNVTAVNVTSKSVILAWEYSTSYICNDSIIKFVIEVTDQYNQTNIQTHNHPLRRTTINQLKSFTYYSIVIYAINEKGSSPKSKPLHIQTMENVPLTMIQDLTATLLNSSSISIRWTFDKDDYHLLNGKFRTFAVTLYENFNMSTLTTIETINWNLILHHLHSSTQYFISVSICNYFDCGSSSLPINIRIPASISDTSINIIHPINKPLILNCPLLTDTPHQYRCGSQLYTIRYFDKPTSIRAKLHYKKSNEIGLKIFYPSEIIETLIITYNIKNSSFINQLNISPPLLNLRLTNLSCGNIYEIKIYTSNQVGFSLTEYLTIKTEGSVPTLIEPKDLLDTISNNYITINMSKWLIDECPMLSYEIEVFPIKNSSEINFNRYLSTENQIQIDKLQSNQDYQLNIKIHSQAGDIIEKIFFRTTDDDDNEQIKIKNQQIIFMMIFIALILMIFVLVLIIRKCLKKSGLFIDQKTRLKPVLYTNKSSRHHHKNWIKKENDFTLDNYIEKNRSDSFVSEDSQGNINPYAVTGYTMAYNDEIDDGSFWQDNKHNHCQLDTTDTCPSADRSERYFYPVILESSLSQDPDLFKRHPNKLLLTNNLSTLSSSADSGVHSSYTQSPRCPLHNSSFDRTNHEHLLYATYNEINLQSYKHHQQQYSLVKIDSQLKQCNVLYYFLFDKITYNKN